MQRKTPLIRGLVVFVAVNLLLILRFNLHKNVKNSDQLRVNKVRALVSSLSHFFIFLFVFTFLNTLAAFAGPSRTTYQARIVKPDGYALEGSNINFKFTILDTSGSCILYSETYSAVNMGSSGGLVSFSLGTGVRTFPVSGSTFEQVFSNTTASLTCDAGGPATYSPSANDTRKIVMQFNDGAGWQTLPAMTINAVPYAMYANDSLKFNGKDITDFVQVASLPTCAASEAVRFNGAGFSCVVVGGSGSVTSGSVIAALGYTPADGTSFTTVTSDINSVSATIASVSSTVYSVATTVTSLQNSVAASFATIVSSQWTTSGTKIYYNSGNVGIGVSDPIARLHIADNGSTNIILDGSLTGPAAAGFLVRKSRGTTASPTAVMNNDYLGTFGARGYGTTGYSTNAKGLIGVKASENWTDTAQGSAIVFETTAISSTTRLEKMRIEASGNVGINTTTPTDGRLVISHTASAPVAGARGESKLAFGGALPAYGQGPRLINLYPSDQVDGHGIGLSNGMTELYSNANFGFFVRGNRADINGTYSSSEVARVNSTGLGLGTTNPAAKLHVVGPTASSNFTASNSSGTIIILDNTTPSAVGVGGSILFGATYHLAGNTMATASIGSSKEYAPSNGPDEYNHSLVFKTNRWTEGVTERMRINSNGFVGIGNANPTRVLDALQGDTTTEMASFINSNSTSSTTDGTLVRIHNTSPNANKAIFRLGKRNSTDTGFNYGDYRLNNVGDIEFAVGTSSGNLGVPEMVLSAAGNLGIGIISPNARLHLVSGSTTLAPLKMTAGNLLSTPQSGTIEYDGTDYYITDNNNVRRTIATASSGGILNNTSVVSSTSGITLWPVTGNSVIVSSTVTSTNSSTGALIVNGGAGIAGPLNVGGVISGSSMVKATGYRANQGAPDAADSSTVGYAFGSDGDTGMFSPIVGGGSANGILAFYSNNGEKMRLTNVGLGIGTTTPGVPLDVMTTGSLTQRLYHVSNSQYDDANLILARSRGTASAPTAVQSGDALGGLYFRGHDGSGISSSSAYIAVSAEENFTGATKGTSMKFGTTVSGTGSYQEIMRIHSNGFVGIGNTTPNALLQVGPSGSQPNNFNIYLASYKSSSGQGQVVGNWAGTNYWGIGPATNSGSDNTIRLGNASDRTGTWSGTQNLNLVMGGALAVGSATVGTYAFQAVKNFNGISNQTAAFIGGIDASTGNTGIYVDQKDNIGLSTNTTKLLNVVHNDTSRFVVTGLGNVGIGTVAPSLMLTVDDTAGTVSSPYSASTDKLAVLGTGNAVIQITTPSSGSGAVYFSDPNDRDPGGIGYSHVTDSMYFRVNDATRMTITSGGAVGIGISNPTGKLDVAGGQIRSEAAAVDVNLARLPSSSEIVLETAGDGSTSAWLWREKWPTGNYGLFHDNTNDNVIFVGSNSPRLSVGLSSGNIGVGTSSPQARLHVAGDVRIVDGNQAAGRVLASDANGTAAWKQSIIHGTIATVGNTSTGIGNRVSSGVSITLPPGRWLMSGMGIVTGTLCRADFGIRTLADSVVKYTLMPTPDGDFQTANISAYVDIASTTTYELYISSRSACVSQIHADNSLWELTATGVAY